MEVLVFRTTPATRVGIGFVSSFLPLCSDGVQPGLHPWSSLTIPLESMVTLAFSLCITAQTNGYLYIISNNLSKISTDLTKISIGLRKISVDLGKISIDLSKISIDLSKIFIDLSKTSIDLSETSIDLSKVQLV